MFLSSLLFLTEVEPSIFKRTKELIAQSLSPQKRGIQGQERCEDVTWSLNTHELMATCYQTQQFCSFVPGCALLPLGCYRCFLGPPQKRNLGSRNAFFSPPFCRLCMLLVSPTNMEPDECHRWCRQEGICGKVCLGAVGISTRCLINLSVLWNNRGFVTQQAMVYLSKVESPWRRFRKILFLLQ